MLNTEIINRAKDYLNRLLLTKEFALLRQQILSVKIYPLQQTARNWSPWILYKINHAISQTHWRKSHGKFEN